MRTAMERVHQLDDFDSSKIELLNSRSQRGKNVCVPIRYNKSMFLFETPSIKLTHGGIPRKNPFYDELPTERFRIYLPIDEKQQNCNKLESFIEKVSEYFNS